MTYGRVLLPGHLHSTGGAAVSHLAELVRGDLFALLKAPSSAPSCRRRVFVPEARLRHDDTTGHLLPKGRRPLRRAPENARKRVHSMSWTAPEVQLLEAEH